MNDLKISELLEKYFEGETSTDEEQTLRRFFATADVPPEWQGYRALFAFFADEQTVTVPEKHVRRISPWWSMAGVAAAVALFFVLNRPKPDYIHYMDGVRVYDEAQTVAKVELQLQTLSKNLQLAQNGMESLDKIQEVSNKLKMFNKIPETLNNIENKITIE